MKTSKPSPRRPSRSSRPCLEPLEDRVVPANVATGQGGNEPTIVVNPTNPNNIISGRFTLRISNNGGVTFPISVTPTLPPGHTGFAADDSLAFDAAGRLFWTYLTTDAVNAVFDVVAQQVNPTTGALIGAPSVVAVNGLDKEWLAADANPASPFANNLYVVWTDFTLPGAAVRFARSTNQGVTWSAPVTISGAGEGFTWPPEVAVGPNGDVWVAWHANGGSVTGDVRMVRSTDGGLTFGPELLPFPAGSAGVTFNSATGVANKINGLHVWLQGSVQPRILVDPVRPNNIYVVCTDDPDTFNVANDPSDVVFARSTNNGATWTQSTISQGVNGRAEIMPAASLDASGNLAVTWYDNRRQLTVADTLGGTHFLLDLFATTSTDGGLTWTAPRQVNDFANTFDPERGAPDRFGNHTERIGEYNGVSVVNGVAYAVWTGNTGTGQQTFFDTFPVATWAGVGANVNITKQAGSQAESAIAINPTNPLNLFATSNGSVFKYSLDGGATWTNSNTAGILPSCCDQQLAWDNFGNLFMTYLDSGLTLVSVVVSTDGGMNFTPVATFTGSVDQPSIAVGAGSVWVDYNRSGVMRARGAAVTGLGVVGAFGAEQTAGGGGSFGDIAIGPAGQVLLTYQNPSGGQGPATIFVNLDPDGLGGAGFNPAVPVTTTNVGGFDFIPAQPGRSVDAEANLSWDVSGGPNTGRVYLVYVDENPDESNDTDLFVRFSNDSGATWSAPVRVNDDVLGNGRSQFNPAIAVDQTTGHVAVTWYDTRNSGTPNNTAQVFGSASFDGGLTWCANILISAGTSNATVAAAGSFNYGDYDKMDFRGGVFYRTWADNSNSTGDNPGGLLGTLDIYTAKVTIAQVKGFKWNDVDGNGTFDAGEAKLAGWTVFADLNTNGSLDAGEPRAVTDAAGNYTIYGVPLGLRQVREIAQAGYVPTFPTGPFLSVTLTNAAPIVSGTNFGNQRVLAPTVFVDNRAFGFRAYGAGWTTGAGGYRQTGTLTGDNTGDHFEHAPGGSAATTFAQWTYRQTLAAGTPYEIFASWTAAAGNASNALFRVFVDNVQVSGDIRANQKVTPNTLLLNGTRWQSLFVYTPGTTGSRLVQVRLFSFDANGTVIADAVLDPPAASAGKAGGSADPAADTAFALIGTEWSVRRLAPPAGTGSVRASSPPAIPTAVLDGGARPDAAPARTLLAARRARERGAAPPWLTASIDPFADLS